MVQAETAKRVTAALADDYVVATGYDSYEGPRGWTVEGWGEWKARRVERCGARSWEG